MAVCAPSEKFLNMGGPLAIGFGAVFAASLGSMRRHFCMLLTEHYLTFFLFVLRYVFATYHGSGSWALFDRTLRRIGSVFGVSSV